MTVLSSKQKWFSESSYLKNVNCLLMKLKVNIRHKSAKQSICSDSKDSLWPVHGGVTEGVRSHRPQEKLAHFKGM